MVEINDLDARRESHSVTQLDKATFYLPTRTLFLWGHWATYFTFKHIALVICLIALHLKVQIIDSSKHIFKSKCKECENEAFVGEGF